MVEDDGKLQTKQAASGAALKIKWTETVIRVLKQEDASSDSTLQNKARKPTNVLI